jgi:hypothetical protein
MEPRGPASIEPLRSEPVLPAGPVQHLLLGALLAAVLIEGSPRTCEPHRWLVRQLKPVLSTLAIYQPRWKLFAPSPTDANSFLTARLFLSDGGTRTWRSPEWRRMTAWERFRHCRHIKYYFYLQKGIEPEEPNPLWPVFADYLARTIPREAGLRVTRVELTGHWYFIPPPTSSWIAYGQPMERIESRQFFSKDYP